MNIKVTYVAQLKSVAGRADETFEMDPPATVRAVIDRVIEEHGPKLREMLLADDGTVRPSILVFADEDQIDPGNPDPLSDRQTLTLLSPLAGG